MARLNSIDVLFVCTGNTCRSPMAEICFQSLVKNSGSSRIAVTSAGFFATKGGAASEAAKKVAESHGLSLANFRSSFLTQERVEKATIIVVMTKAHLSQFNYLYPDAKEKVFLLMGFLGEKKDILDPYGGDEKDFQDCYLTMKPALEALTHHIYSNDSG